MTIARVGDCPKCGGTSLVWKRTVGWHVCPDCQADNDTGPRKVAADAMLRRVRAELHRIIDANPPFASAHEASAVLWEEIEEALEVSVAFNFASKRLLKAFSAFWALVRLKAPDPEKMIEELIQIAAVAARYAAEKQAERSAKGGA